MKTLLATIGGTLTAGDLMMISYTHPQRGGESTIKFKVPPAVDTIDTDPTTGEKTVKSVAPSLSDVVQGFLDELGRGQAWPSGEFEGVRKDDTSLAIKCSDAVSDVEFSAQIEGASSATITLQTL